MRLGKRRPDGQYAAKALRRIRQSPGFLQFGRDVEMPLDRIGFEFRCPNEAHQCSLALSELPERVTEIAMRFGKIRATAQDQLLGFDRFGNLPQLQLHDAEMHPSLRIFRIDRQRMEAKHLRILEATQPSKRHRQAVACLA